VVLQVSYIAKLALVLSDFPQTAITCVYKRYRLNHRKALSSHDVMSILDSEIAVGSPTPKLEACASGMARRPIAGFLLEIVVLDNMRKYNSIALST
jgi:hypothetical protein